MRVLVAPDKFAGTLSALQAAQAIAAGWRRTAPADLLDLAPLSDGGPGFVEVLHAGLGGRLLPVTVTGPLGERVGATVLLVERDGGREAYVESAQACGLALLPPGRRDPTRTTTYGVGELIGAAADAGARRVVVGLGGSGTNDGGAGMLAALGAFAVRPDGTRDLDVLRRGGGALADVTAVDLRTPRDRLAGVEVVAAADVDSPLTGPRGASRGFGPQKGATPAQVAALDEALAGFARAVARGGAGAGPLRQPAAGRDPAWLPGAGAAGGLGYALLLLGARRVPGIDTVLRAVGLPERIGSADLVVTGEGAFDWQSLHGKVVSGVAEAAGRAGRPVVVLAGRVGVSGEECRAAGVAAAYAVVEHAGSPAAALAAPAARLADLAAHVARCWAR